MSDIQTLMEVTGLDRAAAQRVLTVSNNDLERAIHFHLEGNTIDAQPDAAAAQQDAASVIIDDDDDDDYPAPSGAASANDMAAADGDADGSGIRAPIPVRREQMLQPEEDNFRVRVRRPFVTPFGAHNVCPLRNFQLEGELQEAELTAVANGGRPSDAAPTLPLLGADVATIAAGSSSSSSSGGLLASSGSVAVSRIPMPSSRSAAMVIAARATDLTTNGTRRQKRSRLGDLFRPPVDLSVIGTLQTVKDGACAQNRWLIVNLQDNAEFASQVLNRDVWSDENVRAMIAKYFVFWQIAVDMSEGARFQSFYGCRQLPYVCILDPQTGEEKINYFNDSTATAKANTSAGPSSTTASSSSSSSSSVRVGTINAPFRHTAAEFVAELRRYLQSQGLVPDASAPSNIDRSKLIVDDLDTAPTAATATKRTEPVSLSEEEQLRLAIENSLRESQIGGAKATANASRSTDSPGNEAPAKKVAKFKIVDSDDSETTDDDDEDDDDDTLDTFDDDDATHNAAKTGAVTSGGSVPKASAVAASVSATSSTRLRQYTDYLGASSDPITRLQLRLPDGRRENLAWPCSSHIRALRLYVEQTYPDVAHVPYKLLCPFPRQDLLELDETETLLGAKLHPSVLLHVHLDE